jgi:hypothetical protein
MCRFLSLYQNSLAISLSLDGNADEPFTLAVRWQKAIAQFQRSSKYQDLKWLFSDEYEVGLI